MVNPVELAIALGLPSVVWCVIGLFAPRGVPVSVWSTLLVLVLTNLTGRNMGEVARLWMLYMPPLLVGAGYGYDRWGSKPAPLAASTALARPADLGAAIDDPGGLSRVIPGYRHSGTPPDVTQHRGHPQAAIRGTHSSPARPGRCRSRSAPRGRPVARLTSARPGRGCGG